MIKAFKIFLIAVNLIMCGRVLANQQTQLSDQMKSVFANVTLNAVEDLLPLMPMFVGIGRSPSVLTAFLEAGFGQNFVRNMPLSAFRYGDHFMATLNDDQTQRLHQHFKEFLPSPDELKGRTLVLVDYHYSGSTLRAAHKAIYEYYRSLGMKVNIAILAITDVNRSFKPLAPLKKFVQIKDQDGEFFAEHLKSFSEFGRFDIYEVTEPGKRYCGDCLNTVSRSERRPEYQSLVAEYSIWIRLNKGIQLRIAAANSSLYSCKALFL